MDKKQRSVNIEEGRKWSYERGFQYFEVSAENGYNVRESFEYLFTNVLISLGHIKTNKGNIMNNRESFIEESDLYWPPPSNHWSSKDLLECMGLKPMA